MKKRPGIPGGIFFYRGYPRWLFFAGVEAAGALGRGVLFAGACWPLGPIGPGPMRPDENKNLAPLYFPKGAPLLPFSHMLQ